MDFFEYSKFLIAMLAIVDPIAIMPIFFSLTRNLQPDAAKALINSIALTVCIALLVALFLGPSVLTVFGISIPSFRIAGGILLFILALQMMSATGLRAEDVNEAKKITDPKQMAIVPLTIPLLAGPGAFSTVIVYSYRHEAWMHSVYMAVCISMLAIIIAISLHIGQRFVHRISDTTIAVTNKIMGLIIAAIAVEFIANGVKELFNFG